MFVRFIFVPDNSAKLSSLLQILAVFPRVSLFLCLSVMGLFGKTPQKTPKEQVPCFISFKAVLLIHELC